MANQGRPSSCTPDIIEKAAEYVNGAFEGEGQAVPTVEGLCMYIGKARSTVYGWAEGDKNPDFSDILELCNQKQAVLLINGAIRNDMNANIAKLMLGKQGYSEKSIQEHTGAGGGPIKTETTTFNFVPVGKEHGSD